MPAGNVKKFALPDKKVRIEKVTVTPEIAEKWLGTMRKNRPLNNDKFKDYARDIASGDWDLNGSTIVFDEDGHLIDGQHRLWACTEAKRPFITMVVWGVTPESFETIDIGMKRSSSQALKIIGKERSTCLAPASVLLWKYRKKNLQKSISKGPTNKEVISLVATEPKLELSVHKGVMVRHLVSPSVGAFVHFVLAQKDEFLADEFFEQLSTGNGLMEGMAVYALRERLIRIKGSLTRLTQREIVILFFTAWNFLREKKKVTKNAIQLVKRGRGHVEAEFPTVK